MTLPKITISLLLTLFLSCDTLQAGTPKPKEVSVAGWPPVVGASYPDLKVVDHRGDTFALSKLKGRPILIELTAMPCAGCQAFSGGNTYGAYGKVRPQKNLNSIEKYIKQFGKGMDIADSRFHFVQLMLYDLKMGTPSPEEIKKWAKHFKLDKNVNSFVVTPVDSRPKDSYDLIPGFHLVDKNFNLVSDSSGHRPKHNLYRHLIPLLSKIVLSGQ